MGKPIVSGVKYSKKDVLALFATFNKFDRNKDGSISVKEMYDAVKLDDYRLPMNHLEFLRLMDANKDGTITFDEFLLTCYPNATPQERNIMYSWAIPEKPAKEPSMWTPKAEELEEIKSMFMLYDTNKNGVLEWQEVATMAKNTGYDEDEIDALFNKADLNNDKVIGFDEFVEMVKHSYIK
mmetsp:Transcript_16888/g.50634  ORF Transcript_16888/g.50634 Transcript_16888/m.50634 type:complete len:181 (+) Transcript_16888:323-865(+)